MKSSSCSSARVEKPRRQTPSPQSLSHTPWRACQSSVLAGRGIGTCQNSVRPGRDEDLSEFSPCRGDLGRGPIRVQSGQGGVEDSRGKRTCLSSVLAGRGGLGKSLHISRSTGGVQRHCMCYQVLLLSLPSLFLPVVPRNEDPKSSCCLSALASQ